MSRQLAAAILLAEFLCGAALLIPAFFGLAFLAEVLRRAPLPLAGHLMRLAAMLTAFVPLASVIIVAVKVLGGKDKGPVPASALWTPVLAALASGVLFVALIHSVEFVGTRAR